MKWNTAKNDHLLEVKVLKGGEKKVHNFCPSDVAVERRRKKSKQSIFILRQVPLTSAQVKQATRETGGNGYGCNALFVSIIYSSQVKVFSSIVVYFLSFFVRCELTASLLSVSTSGSVSKHQYVTSISFLMCVCVCVSGNWLTSQT